MAPPGAAWARALGLYADEERDERIITPGQRNPLYCSNEVRNSKYTALTFLPLNLYEQFRLPLNRYFLLVTLLQFLPVIAPVSPISTLLPLALAFLLTAAKEGYDDLRRHRADRHANFTPYHVWRDGRVQLVPCRAIAVGDWVKVLAGQEFPCDLFLVISSDPEGVAYVETANLDGESDLKARSCVAEIVAQVGRTSGERPPTVRFTLQAEPPRGALYSFEGSIVLNFEEIPVSSEQLLQQACYLRNTAWVWGVAVYTGHQTKVNLNKSGPSVKRSKVDSTTSRFAVVMFVLQILLALACGTIGSYMAFETKLWYVFNPELDRANLWHYLVYPGRFFLLTSVMIPISFKVITDISKYWISLCIAWDLSMYDSETDTPAGVKDTSIAEDLGQVQVLLSDKTGTLTENVMLFKCCTIGGVVYGAHPPSPEADLGRSPSMSSDLGLKLQDGDPLVLTFFRILALCHSVFPKVVDGDIVYHGSSPDEEALVKAARRMGVTLTRRTKDALEIDVLGTPERYEVLETLDFTSERRRMGIVVRNLETDVITLLVKGADDKITERLASTSCFSPAYVDREGHDVLARDLANLSLFAAHGLRTLCVALRVLSEDALRTWRVEYSKAKVARGDRRSKDLGAACDLLETDLQLVGASAIEDRLQDQVPETLATLRQAGITIWMLTGDKYETAKQIAISCGLLSSSDECLVVVGSSAPEVTAGLKDIYYKYHGRHGGRALQRHVAHSDSTLLRTEQGTFIEEAPLVSQPPALPGLSTSPTANDDMSQSWPRESTTTSLDLVLPSPVAGGYALIIAGDTLEVAMTTPCRELFLRLALAASGVVCCRSTPPVKAAVVELVRAANLRTLAVGDGGNDVAMLHAADVGVGIAGREGRQAARAADYSIAQFRHLVPLLLVHGHYSYERTCYIVQYCFYKSMLLSFVQLLYNCLARFSGVSFWDGFQLAMFNGLFTLAPIFFYVLDRSLPRDHLPAHPKLYRYTQAGGSLNRRTFALFLFRAQGQAILVTGFLAWLYGPEHVAADGRPVDRVGAAFMAYGALMALQVVVVLLESNSVTVINGVAVAGTFLLYWAVMLAYCAVPFTDQYFVMQHYSSDPTFFLVQLLLLAVTALPLLAVRYVLLDVAPTELQAHRCLVAHLRRLARRQSSATSTSPASMSIRDSHDDIATSSTAPPAPTPPVTL